MHVPVGFVNARGRVVGDKDIYRGHLLHQAGNLVLIVEIVPRRFVTPAAVEAPDADSLEIGRIEVHIADRASEGSRAIVVALYGEYSLTAAVFGGVQYNVVGNIAAGEQQVSAPCGISSLRHGEVGNNADIHGVIHGPVTDSLAGDRSGQPDTDRNG